MWTKAAGTRVDASLTKLATAIKLTREAGEELDESLGVMQLIADGTLTVRPLAGGYGYHLPIALEELGAALVRATEQQDALKPKRAPK
jgi:hypothetical protein